MLTCSSPMQDELESERKSNEAALADEQEGKRAAQVSWAPVHSAGLKLCSLRKLLKWPQPRSG